jgi:hypothetical protein
LALVWKIRAVAPETAEEGTGFWEPFAAVRTLEGEDVILLKGLVEDEENNPKSSTQA